MSDLKPTNPKDSVGCKKVSLGLVPDTATAWAAMAHHHGALKYGRYNWRTAGVRVSIYVDAIKRHLGAYWNGEDLDRESGLPHLAHVLACVNILLDAESCSKLTDDRPVFAPVGDLQDRLNRLTKQMVEGSEEKQVAPAPFFAVVKGERVEYPPSQRPAMLHKPCEFHRASLRENEYCSECGWLGVELRVGPLPAPQQHPRLQPMPYPLEDTTKKETLPPATLTPREKTGWELAYEEVGKLQGPCKHVWDTSGGVIKGCYRCGIDYHTWACSRLNGTEPKGSLGLDDGD